MSTDPGDPRHPVRRLARAATILLATISATLALTAGSARAAATPQLTPAGGLTFVAPLGGPGVPSQQVTLTNIGDQELGAIAVSIAGANAARYTLSSQCGPTLAAGGSCTIDVGFATPPAAGTFAAVLEVVSNAATNGGVETLALRGHGVTSVPAAGASPASLTFTSSPGATSAPQEVTLTNSGNAPLTGIVIALFGTSFTITATTCGAGLEPGATCSATVTFTPPDAREDFRATLRYSSSDPLRPFVDVPLIGSGAATAAAPTDRDLDKVADAVDACPVVPGNLQDGCPALLGAQVKGRWRVNELLTQLVSLTVRAPIGSRIDFSCRGKRQGACSFRTRRIAATTKRITSLTRQFKGRRILPADTTITIRVTKPLYMGTYERLITRRDRQLPRVTNRCLTARGRARDCP